MELVKFTFQNASLDLNLTVSCLPSKASSSPCPAFQHPKDRAAQEHGLYKETLEEDTPAYMLMGVVSGF